MGRQIHWLGNCLGSARFPLQFRAFMCKTPHTKNTIRLMSIPSEILVQFIHQPVASSHGLFSLKYPWQMSVNISLKASNPGVMQVGNWFCFFSVSWWCFTYLTEFWSVVHWPVFTGLDWTTAEGHLSHTALMVPVCHGFGGKVPSYGEWKAGHQGGGAVLYIYLELVWRSGVGVCVSDWVQLFVS